MTRAASVTPLLLLVLCLSGCDKSSTPAAAASDATVAEAPAPSEPEPQADAPAPVEEPTLANAAVDPSSVVAPAPAPDPAPEVAPEPAPDEEPAELPTYKVLILGDSLIATGFGALLERSLDAHPQVTCYRKGKSSSGLARPDFFDWMAEAKRQVDLRKPDLVVVLMGGNDGQDLTHRNKKAGRRVTWKHENWEASYRERMDSFLAQVTAPDRDIVWLGMPTMGLRSLEKKLVTIRGVQKAAVEAHESASYVETAPFVSNEDGGMLTHAVVGSRKKKKAIRADDKIHFTMAGSQFFADAVYPEVLEALAVEDVAQDED
ncbi:MAG: DUF459 domain-containing protein [Nannocystaceae bacterium]|nr:DUF459 domain-containing protein [Nannocystaceae bacterium]